MYYREGFRFPLRIGAQEIRQHLLRNFILKYFHGLHDLPSRIALNSGHHAMQRRPLFYHYFVFLTVTFIELERRYMRTRPPPWHFRFFTTLHAFQRHHFGLLPTLFRLLQIHIARQERTLVLVFDTQAAKATPPVRLFFLNCKSPKTIS